MVALDQMKMIDPSVPGALFRLLQRDESVAYLREGDGIYGFEVHHDSPDIAGYALIGMSKHTILAYKSDIGQEQKLIIFPNIDKLFNKQFGLLELLCTKKLYLDESFNGRAVKTGLVKDLVRDLLPPAKEVPDLSDELTSQITRIMSAEYNDADNQDTMAYRPEFVGGEKAKPVKLAQKPTPAKKVEPKVEVRKKPQDALLDNDFESVDQVIDYCVLNYSMNRVVLSRLHQAMIDSFVQKHKNVDLSVLQGELTKGYIKLVSKALNQEKLGWE